MMRGTAPVFARRVAHGHSAGRLGDYFSTSSPGSTGVPSRYTASTRCMCAGVDRVRSHRIEICRKYNGTVTTTLFRVLFVPEDSFIEPGRTPRSQPGELVFEFVRVSDHAHFRCELHEFTESDGFDVQMFKNGNLISSDVFATRGNCQVVRAV